MAGFEHSGPARVLVHRLKYEGVGAVAGVFAPPMAALICFPVGAVTYVPRVRSRRWRYGIDQSRVLAHAVAAELGVPVVPTLISGWWSPPSAGAAASARRAPRFTVAQPGLARFPRSWILVDDVLTTGLTIAKAARLLKQSFPIDVRSVVATSASEVTSLRSR